MATNKDLTTDIPNFIRVYKDGSVERLFHTPYAPPSFPHSTNNITSKDITISPHISARLYLPTPPTPSTKLPIFVYFHGGGFCLGSSFALLEHTYLGAVLSHVHALIVSVDYRLAPEHPLPAAYQDCWAALQWVASHSSTTVNQAQNLDDHEPWLAQHGDFDRVYLGGDSAGGNIVHNMAMQAGSERLNGDVKIVGGFLGCPYFWGSKPGTSVCDESLESMCWRLSYPDAPGGIDNPMINPMVGGDGGRGLVAGLGCRKMLVVVAEKDPLREKGLQYYEAVKGSEWDGEVELVDVEGEEHCFYAFDTGEKAVGVLKKVASFIV